MSPTPPTVSQAPQTVAFVIPRPWSSVKWTTDFGLFVRALRAQGHDAAVYCTEFHEGTPDYPVFEAPLAAMSEPAFWRARGVGIGLVFSWLLLGGPVLAALRRAGAYTISRGDSDGWEGVRVFPGARLRKSWHMADGLAGKCRALSTMAKNYAYVHRREDATLVENVENADVTTLENAVAVANFGRFLDYKRRPDLRAKVRLMRTPLYPPFFAGPAESLVKPDALRLVAIGQWGAAQKDAPLLARTLDRFLASWPDAQVTLLGRGGDAPFADLLRRRPQVRYPGPVPSESVRDHLAHAHILLSSSRWEGMPVSAFEALTQGCTTVGTALPCWQALAWDSEGPFGSVAGGRGAAALGAALDREAAAWRAGARDPRRIAALWRPRLTPEALSREILDLAERGGGFRARVPNGGATGYNGADES